MSKETIEMDFSQVAASAAPRIIVPDKDAELPLAVVPEGIVLESAERVALSRMMEYTRKGSMRKRNVTRQQWVEDFLTRGFTKLEELRYGRAPARLRITAPERIDRRGRPQFYEVQSAIEIAYVKRRHAELYGKKEQVRAEPAPELSPELRQPTRGQQADGTGTATGGTRKPSGGLTVPVEQPVVKFGTPWADWVDQWLRSDKEHKRFGREDWKLEELEDLDDSFDWKQMALEIAAQINPADKEVLQKAVNLTMGLRGAAHLFNNGAGLGNSVALLERGDVWARAYWKMVQVRGMNRKAAEAVPLPAGRALRDELRKWAGEESWVRFLRDRDVLLKGAVARQESSDAAPVDENGADFHYERGRVIAPAGKKARVRANIAAIRLLFRLEAENRNATPAEKEVLAKFNGWGEHKALFENHDLFLESYKRVYGDSSISIEQEARTAKERYGDAAGDYSGAWRYVNWRDTYGDAQRELRELVSEEEFNAASHSILNAHYTSEEICHWMWDAVKKAGFTGGRVLEPAVGASGRILGAMPSELRRNSRVEAVELDTLSARMAAKLYPQTKVHACGFEEAMIAPGSMDLVIANVPFNETGPGVQDGPVHFNLHNYFIAESMRKLKPGGIACIITSASTLQNNDDQREELSKMAELWGAVRLPSDTFKASAGTEVVTDILMLRKPDGVMHAEAEPWNQVLPVGLPPDGVKVIGNDGEGGRIETAMVNEYFVRHPEMVMGYHSMNGRMYGSGEKTGQYTVLSQKDAPPLAERMEKALRSMPVMGMSRDVGGALGERRVVADASSLMAYSEELSGSMVLRDQRDLYIVRPDTREIIPPDWLLSGDLPSGFRDVEAAKAMAVEYCELRDSLAKLIAGDLNPTTTDETSEANRRELKDRYEAFHAEHGSLYAVSKRLRSLAPQDSTMGSVLALEQVVEDKANKRKKQVVESDILNKRTLFPVSQQGMASAATIEEAVMASMNQTGRLSLPYMADLLGDGRGTDALAEEIIKAGLGFRSEEDPEELVHRSRYLSGDVLTKLEKIKKVVEVDPRFGVNKAALAAAAPPPVPFERVRVPFGATWVPGHLYRDFINEETGGNFQDGRAPYYDQRAQTWNWPALSSIYSQAGMSKFGTGRRPWADVVMLALAQKNEKVYDTFKTKDGETVRTFNAEETAALRSRVETIGAAWTAWISRREDTRKLLTDEFNRRFNRVVVQKYDGSHLKFPGMAGGLTPRFYQANAVERFIQEPAGIIAHGTGYGKTLTAILVAHEHVRMGLSKKPLMVCDTANYGQFCTAFRTFYPQDRILVADDANFSPAERENFKAMAAYGKWDCVLMSRTQFEQIPLSSDTLRRWAAAEVADLRWSMNLARTNDNKRAQRAIEKKLVQKEAELKALIKDKAVRADPGLTWEQLGVDLLLVDECHRHKKTGFATTYEDIKGIDCAASNRGRDLLMKAAIIQDRRGGMGVIGMSGTPATNTMAEFWNMNRLFAPNTLRDFNVMYFDEFKTAFCQTETRLEMNEANGKFRYVERMSKFVNGAALSGFVRAGADIQLDPTKLKLKLPEHETGATELEVVPITDPVLEQMERLAGIYERYENMEGKDRRDYSWVPLTLMTMGMAASIDPRLIDADAPDDPESLSNRVVGNAAEIYHKTAAKKSAQVIFLDRYRTMNTSILDSLVGDPRKARLVVDDTRESVSVDDPAAEREPPVIFSGVNLYADLKSKLVARGVKPEEIALISDAKTPKDREAIFEKVNRGDVRIIIGSSDKLGIGANFQERLYAAHHFDPPRNMTPDQQEQRDGRIVRSGNTNEKVRVLNYGMQDTCTVAIINRIQTKRRFIRAGLSETGGDDEIEDVGEIRIEEFKAALVPDKRQLQLSELDAAIRDERMAINVAMQRIQSLGSHADMLAGALRHEEETALPSAREAVEWLKASTRPFDGEVVVDVSGLRSVAVKSDALAKWLDENKEPIKGNREEVEKKLGKLVEILKATELGYAQNEKQLGTLNINGFTVRLVFAEYQLLTSRRAEKGLLMQVRRGPEADAKSFGGFDRFASPGMLLRTTGNTLRFAEEKVKSSELLIQQRVQDLAAVKKEIDAQVPPSTEKLVQLREQKATLERDMVEHPYVRGSKRSKKAEIKVESLRPAGR
jgi:N12 class adenine-specific DNA methylase